MYIFPDPAVGLPPSESAVGPRYALTDDADVYLSAGTYSQKRFTGAVQLSSDSGAYVFRDCAFDAGFGIVYGGTSFTRTVLMEYCSSDANKDPTIGGLCFGPGGQKDWTIRRCHLCGAYQALRPNGMNGNDDKTTPTPFLVEDSIVEMTEVGTPIIHCESMQALGGNSMSFIRVRFISPLPFIDGTTGQTASINFGGGNTLFDACEFCETHAYYYTVYSDGTNVLFRNCKFGIGLAGYLYPKAEHAMPTLEGCTDYDNSSISVN
jgi:hypothetical protein